MIAVVIDPLVCHTWVGYLLPECWGVAVMTGACLTALTCAVSVRQLARVR